MSEEKKQLLEKAISDSVSFFEEQGLDISNEAFGKMAEELAKEAGKKGAEIKSLEIQAKHFSEVFDRYSDIASGIAKKASIAGIEGEKAFQEFWDYQSMQYKKWAEQIRQKGIENWKKQLKIDYAKADLLLKSKMAEAAGPVIDLYQISSNLQENNYYGAAANLSGAVAGGYVTAGSTAIAAYFHPYIGALIIAGGLYVSIKLDDWVEEELKAWDPLDLIDVVTADEEELKNGTSDSSSNETSEIEVKNSELSNRGKNNSSNDRLSLVGNTGDIFQDIVVRNSDGSIDVYLPDGTHFKENEFQNYNESPGDRIEFEVPGKAKYIIHNDLSYEVYYNDGVKLTGDPYGDIQKKYYLPDDRILIIYKDGKKELIHPDGSKEVDYSAQNPVIDSTAISINGNKFELPPGVTQDGPNSFTGGTPMKPSKEKPIDLTGPSELPPGTVVTDDNSFSGPGTPMKPSGEKPIDLTGPSELPPGTVVTEDGSKFSGPGTPIKPSSEKGVDLTGPSELPPGTVVTDDNSFSGPGTPMKPSSEKPIDLTGPSELPPGTVATEDGSKFSGPGTPIKPSSEKGVDLTGPSELPPGTVVTNDNSFSGPGTPIKPSKEKPIDLTGSRPDGLKVNKDGTSFAGPGDKLLGSDNEAHDHSDPSAIKDYDKYNFAPEDLLAEKPSFGKSESVTSPIIIDLDNDGVETLSVNDKHYFDHDANAFAESTGWVSRDDGLLVWDKNNNGVVDSGAELFGNQTTLASGQKAKHGYDALAEFDDNKDGVIDAQDAIYSSLSVWQDKNENGLTDTDELASLADVGIKSLSTVYEDSNYIDAQGNEHRQTSEVTWSDGHTSNSADVWFKTNTSYRITKQKFHWSYKVMTLPNSRGYGNLLDLRQAMTLDDKLVGMVEAFTQEKDYQKRNDMVQDIIYQWAGVTDVDPNSRDPKSHYGHVIDARKLITLEKIVGKSYLGTWCWGERDPNPHGRAAPILKQEFDKFQRSVTAQLNAQVLFDKDVLHALFEANSWYFRLNEKALEAHLVSLNRPDKVEELNAVINTLQNLGVYSECISTHIKATLDSIIENHPSLNEYINHDTVAGDERNNTLRDYNQINIIHGKKGNDTLYGQDGDDNYIFAQGDGQDIIYDTSGVDTLYFAEGIKQENIGFRRTLTDVWVVLLDGDGNPTGDEIKLTNYFDFDGTLAEGQIEKVHLSDGTLVNLYDLLKQAASAATENDDHLFGLPDADNASALAGNDKISTYGGDDTIEGGAGDDEILAGDGNDTLIGGVGNDTLVGEEGSDTYQFSQGF
uniref:calcium-binding protein n=1 Tax=Zooshikella ganghwensis TaxID=202772 RepID=UPI000482B2AC